jgi:hypothetical protein
MRISFNMFRVTLDPEPGLTWNGNSPPGEIDYQGGEQS